jgi:hypothetical protein
MIQCYLCRSFRTASWWSPVSKFVLAINACILTASRDINSTRVTILSRNERCIGCHARREAVDQHAWVFVEVVGGGGQTGVELRNLTLGSSTLQAGWGSARNMAGGCLKIARARKAPMWVLRIAAEFVLLSAGRGEESPVSGLPAPNSTRAGPRFRNQGLLRRAQWQQTNNFPTTRPSNGADNSNTGQETGPQIGCSPPSNVMSDARVPGGMMSHSVSFSFSSTL